MRPCDRRLPLAQVAALIGVSERALRKWSRGTPPLAVELLRGKAHCTPADAYAYARDHARCPQLRTPPGLELSPAADAPTSALDQVLPEIRAVLGNVDITKADPEALALQLAMSGVSEKRCAVIIQSVRAMQSRRSIDLRAGKAFTADEVTGMLRDHAELVVDQIEASATAYAAKLLRLLATDFALDTARNPTALQTLESHFRAEFGQALIRSMRERLEHQVAGIAPLFAAPSSTVESGATDA